MNHNDYLLVEQNRIKQAFVDFEQSDQDTELKISLEGKDFDYAKRILTCLSEIVIARKDKIKSIDFQGFSPTTTENESTIDHELSHLQKYLNIGHAIDNAFISIKLMHDADRISVIPALKIKDGYLLPLEDKILIAMSPKEPSDGDLINVYLIYPEVIYNIDNIPDHIFGELIDALKKFYLLYSREFHAREEILRNFLLTYVDL